MRFVLNLPKVEFRMEIAEWRMQNGEWGIMFYLLAFAFLKTEN